jgi:CubicO group peptidase (beta-lactamase class C family)
MNATNDLPRSTPEAQGIASDAVLRFLDAAASANLELHSLMLLRRGMVIAEGWWKPYGPQIPHMLYSLSKSFTSTAAGLAIAEGRLSLDDPVISFFPDDLPDQISDNLRAMQVRHLLSMSTGHTQEPVLWQATDGNWPRQFLAAPVEQTPGTHFLYNTPATYMVSAILFRTTGEHLLDYLTPRLLEPLGIEGAVWETCPRGIATGGYGLNITTEDIARFGLLYQQKGVWNGTRLLSEAWVEAATSKQVENGTDPNNDWNQGYGYQFWRSRCNAYRGDGAFGQFCIVMPDQEAVLVITSGVGNMGAILNLVWNFLLPAMQSTPLPENPDAARRLSDMLAALALPAPVGETASPVAARVSGKLYLFGENDLGITSMTPDFRDGKAALTLHDADRAHRLTFGIGEWKTGETTFLRNRITRGFLPGDTEKTAVYGAWTAPDTLTLKICFYVTPFAPTLTLRFADDRLFLDLRGNVGFGPAERPTLEGQAARFSDAS